MKGLFILLAVANILMFGLGQGWFGTTRSDAGRQSALMQNQLNGDALVLGQAQLQAR